ncbi:MAG: hypothetical protein ABI612_05415 [Betaproteobacteria bacterium]
MSRRAIAFATLALAALLTACAAPSQPGAMIAAPAGALHESSETISVAVAGGKPTSSMRGSQIADEDFAKALRESIEKSGLFAKVSNDPDAHYRLDAFIGQLSQPFAGFDMTVTMEVSYTLTDAQLHQRIWQKNVLTSHTATVGDAFAGVKRLQLANEGAARKNIEQALQEMSQLGLQ